MVIDSQIVINGTDITDYIAENGIKWSRNDIDGPNAGRTMSGLMIRDRVATKIRLDITCRELNETELNELMLVLYPEFVTVQYRDPLQGNVSKTMYSNDNSATMNKVDTAGVRQWGTISFPLIER